MARNSFKVAAGALLAILAGCLGGELSAILLEPSPLVPTWSKSYQLYGQPHAIWLSRYERVSANRDLLTRTLKAATRERQVPEIVIYSIPLRDLGQSSEGGFTTYEDYLADNQENAGLIRRFVEETGLRPIVYLEPDSIPLAVQYRLDHNFDAQSQKIYADRIRVMNQLIDLYQSAGAKAYLEAGHSDWFDYADENIRRIASALNEAGIAKATGLASNVSNRQPVFSPDTNRRTEFRYLKRLLPLLNNLHLDVRVDTSRNGGPTKARTYYLAPNYQLWDNEIPQGRLVGSWKIVKSSDGQSQRWLYPFFGKPRLLKKLVEKEKYTWDEQHSLLTAPAWLDAVGDVQPGPPPTDTPPAQVRSVIQHYRYIKPPDDCDGAINCPPGASKHEINGQTNKQQPQTRLLMPWS